MSISALLNNEETASPARRSSILANNAVTAAQAATPISASMVIPIEPSLQRSSAQASGTVRKRKKSTKGQSAGTAAGTPATASSDHDDDYFPSKAAKRRRGTRGGASATSSHHTPLVYANARNGHGRRSNAGVDPDETESSSGGSAVESSRRASNNRRGGARAASPAGSYSSESDISSLEDEALGHIDDEDTIALERAAYAEHLHRFYDDITQLAADARLHFRTQFQKHQLERYEFATMRGREQAKDFFHDEAMALVLHQEEELERERKRNLRRAQKKRRRNADKLAAAERSARALEEGAASAALATEAAAGTDDEIQSDTGDHADGASGAIVGGVTGVFSIKHEDGTVTSHKSKKTKHEADDKRRRSKTYREPGEHGDVDENSVLLPSGDEDDFGADDKPKKKSKKKKHVLELDEGDEAALKITLTTKSRKGHRGSKSGSGSTTGKPGDKADKSGTDKTATAPADRATADKAALVARNTMPTSREIKMYAKSYNTMYDAIWRDIARKDAPKIARVITSSVSIKQTNARKTVQLAVKEARRWQFRTNKNVKDLQAKARRAMREMLVYWKRNEREERDSRRKAEKEAMDRAKKDEEQREARRQARKLNFLITQTELYSHFIGRKIKTDEIEAGSTDDGVAVDEKEAQVQKQASAAERANKPEEDDELIRNARKTGVAELDFDGAEDADLHRAALENAHSAVVSAQNRAKTFDKPAHVDADTGEMNFQNPTTLGEIDIQQPKLLSCTLKGYQLKGLNWLVNLYEQGINGILADEMGLGKTVQSISVMAYLAEVHNIWGPFLVIAPASTLHNWQQEITKFVPDFKALPYWGNAKDRKILRKFWDRKQLTYTKDAPFHVLITSYQLIVADAQYFQRIKWQYMVLDEAQAIKSSSSTRWKSLLGFQCRNRLLLTGTPIQNSMQELWALLHFIMPTLFDSHDEFSEWFSKDIESHATSNTQLNEEQLKRLHMILKPFMLRRVKKHVQSELGDKIEIDLYCDLTYRQREMYRALKAQINIQDIMDQVDSDDSSQNLMNLVMQFRKVCNHPDLFERSDTKSPLSLALFPRTGSFLREGNVLDVEYNTRNFINYKMPKMLYREGLLTNPGEKSQAGFRNKYLDHMLNIWEPDYIRENQDRDGAFSWLKFVDTSASDVHRAFHGDLVSRAVTEFYNKVDSGARLAALSLGEDAGEKIPAAACRMLLVDELKDQSVLQAMLTNGVSSALSHVSNTYFHSKWLHQLDPMCDPAAVAPPVELKCSDAGFVTAWKDTMFDVRMQELLYAPSPQFEERLIVKHVPPYMYPPTGLLPEPSSNRAGYAPIRVPPMSKFVTDSAKLLKLDSLLAELKANDHRVLIYFQMTRMMDLMEEYLTYKQYKYVRLDGSSKLGDRRDLVNDWQTRPELFVFLLSTRAGGLGINLTAADTVVFYDSDWNPTIDSQAMDRAHRLGQTKQVTVYRLLVRGTIEERMRDRAKQKMHVQQVVMEGGTSGSSGVTGGSGGGGGVDFQKPAREVAYWLLE
ncbi:SNF2 family N-terminal domain-containing protein [Limtongia smithiae]|uniref:SNF2 family N-terminal domain-containing protein n=1 Tax=Limtongia smithiae TaxID=1125753 RepID=UPI0034CECFF7